MREGADGVTPLIRSVNHGLDEARASQILMNSMIRVNRAAITADERLIDDLIKCQCRV